MSLQLDHSKPLRHQASPSHGSEPERAISPLGRFIGSLLCITAGVFSTFPFMSGSSSREIETAIAATGAVIGWLVYSIGSRLDQ